MKSAMSSLFRAGVAAALFAASFACVAQPAPGLVTPFAALAKAKPQLNLNTAQQQRWDEVVAQGVAARESARAAFAQIRAQLLSELAKPEPDLAAVAVAADAARQQSETLHRATRDAWLALYATFSPEQKAVVRDALSAWLASVASRRPPAPAARAN